MPRWMSSLLALTLLTAASASALAQERSHETIVVIPAPAPQVWQALTTAEGWKRMGVKLVMMDFRIGGTIETSYNDGAKAGDAGNIKNQVVAYIPGRMLALRNTQAPPNFPYPGEFATTATVFELAPVDAASTRVTATGVGYGTGAGYDWLIRMFQEGNAWSLNQLARSFAAGAAPDEAGTKAMTRQFERK